MKVIKTDIPDVVIIEPRLFRDSRGYFFESFSEKDFKNEVADIDFVQDNESMSSYGVMRGLHFQKPPYTQSKLVRCVKGRVIDVAVDIRKGSPTYGQHVAVELTEDNHRQFFIPKGFAHGFAVLSETAIFQYKCDNFYHPEADGGINILDESLNIDWKISIDNIVLSDKDTKHPLLKDFMSPFAYGEEAESEEDCCDTCDGKYKKEPEKDGVYITVDGMTYKAAKNSNSRECDMLSNMYRCWLKSNGKHCPLDCEKEHFEYVGE